MRLETLLAKKIRKLREKLTRMERQQEQLADLKREILGESEAKTTLPSKTGPGQRRKPAPREFGPRVKKILDLLPVDPRFKVSTPDTARHLGFAEGESEDQATGRVSAALSNLYNLGLVDRANLNPDQGGRPRYAYWKVLRHDNDKKGV